MLQRGKFLPMHQIELAAICQKSFGAKVLGANIFTHTVYTIRQIELAEPCKN